jgi:tripartite-type tricarboxylate transporter receptor subunit TctC
MGRHFLKAKLMRALALGVLALTATAALAQYPSRVIKLVVPIPAGGAPDIAARVVGQKLSELLGQPVVVDNHAGSNGNIAGDMVAKSSLPVRNFQEFIEYARRTAPPLPYASGGNGSQHHLSMEMLKQRAGIDLLHVPFKGGTPATMATVAGDTSAMFSGTSAFPQIKAGKLRALAVTGARRSPEFPELPTIGEFYPGYEVTIWLALFAPAGTPEPVLSRLRAAVAKALAAPEVKERLNSAGGLEPFASTPEEFVALIRRDYDKYGKIVKAIGIRVD